MSDSNQIKIAIQGIKGSFHHEAALKFFKKDICLVDCHSFKDLALAITKKKLAQYAMMAIENSDAGSILNNYALIKKYNLQIIGEYYLPIKQNLLALPNISLNQINEIHSHPMALLQSNIYLDSLHKKLVETEDTALSAKILSEKRTKTIAVVAGKLAAKIYGLNILAESIQNDKKNITRFLALSTPSNENIIEANKATVYFVCSHEKGSLAKILTRIADYNINLSKLQSMPISGAEFKYGFYADLEFEDIKDWQKVHQYLQNNALAYNFFGCYKKGKN